MITVLHLSHLINYDDFIDVVIRYADHTKFRMLAATLTDAGSVRPGSVDYPVVNLQLQSRLQWSIGMRRLRRFMEHEKVTILHTHHIDSTLLGALALVKHPHIRLVIGRHYSDALYQLTPAWKRRAYLGLEAFCNHSASRIIAPSSTIHALLVHRQRVPAWKVVHIPYGFNFAKHVASHPEAPDRLRRTLGLEGKWLIGSFSRLNVDKGHADLLAAIASLRHRWPSLHLILVGDGNARQQLEEQVKRLGLADTISFLGWRTDVIDLMAMVDFIVQPSLHEAFSQVMVEALAMGKPLIITDVSGAQDVVRHRWNGLIVPRHDPPQLATAIEELLQQPEMARTFGVHGHESVRRDLDIRTVIARYEALYREALGRPQPSSVPDETQLSGSFQQVAA